MRNSALLFMVLSFTAAHAAPPVCEEMADKLKQKFESVRKMSGIDRTETCRAISLLISDLSDMYSQCAVDKNAGIDENFVNKVYLPLAKEIGVEAQRHCGK